MIDDTTLYRAQRALGRAEISGGAKFPRVYVFEGKILFFYMNALRMQREVFAIRGERLPIEQVFHQKHQKDGAYVYWEFDQLGTCFPNEATMTKEERAEYARLCHDFRRYIRN